MMRQRLQKIHLLSRRVGPLVITLSLFACVSAPPPSKPVAPAVASTAPAPAAPPVSTPQAAQPPTAPATPSATYRRVGWNELPGWREDNVAEAWSAFLASCGAIASREGWREVCAAASRITTPSAESARRFFELHFAAYQIFDAEGTDSGLITGYYEPLLRGSRKASARYRFPLFGVPDDLLVVDLGDLYPELKGMRLRGRMEGRRVVPYYDRGQIENGQAPLRGKELVWVDDAVDLFFLHIQGSGRILLDSGETIRVGYADQNGHPYRSIGRLLVERGELALEHASMQGIRTWARENPARVSELLNSNASYVFFRELPATGSGPPGALGIPLVARRSVAVDPRHVPLGAPVYLATTWPNTARPLNRLALAQDTGGAIRGAVRADFFWGYGEAAAREAGRMRQRLRMWVLLPHAHPVPAGSLGG